MSHLEIIQELCGICAAQNEIILAQTAALAQMGAVVMEEKRAAVAVRFNALIGADEAPDLPEDGEGVRV